MAENPPPAATDSSGRSLAEIIAAAGAGKLPPVDKWHPTHCGDSDMRIARDGTWYYAGSPIGRPALVKLFSTVLRREPDGSFVLVTPAEKLDIAVEDAPFIAVEVTSAGAGEARTLAFRLNTDDHVVAGPDHAIRVETAADGTPRPYLHVRRGLDALIARSVFLELVNLAFDEGRDPPGLWSSGAFFAFGPA